MKKILLFVSAVILSASCSSDDGSNGDLPPGKPADDYTYSTKITPPKWIQGTWVHKDPNGNINNSVGFKFSQDDFCHFDAFVNYCWKDAIKNPNDEKFVQEISANRYRLLIVNEHGIINESGIYNEFIKKSDNEIIRKGYNNSSLTDTYIKI